MQNEVISLEFSRHINGLIEAVQPHIRQTGIYYKKLFSDINYRYRTENLTLVRSVFGPIKLNLFSS